MQSVRSKIGNRQSELTRRIEFLLQTVDCRIFESVCMSSNRTSLNRFKTRAVELNFIHFSFRFVESSFVRWIGICICLCINVFTTDQRTSISANWNFIFFLSFWCSFFQFLQRFLTFFAQFIILRNETMIVIGFRKLFKI